MKMVVGLGNPGLRYRKTRHNLGFWVLDALAEELGASWKKKRKFSAWLAQGSWQGKSLVLVKPATFVNLSGEAVRKVMDYFGLEPRDVLVVVDDANLEPGSIRLRAQGGPGGHHGLESIDRSLGSRDYPRIRVGIGGGELEDLTGHVLSPVRKAEGEQYRRTVATVIRALAAIAAEGLEAAMNSYNQKIKSERSIKRKEEIEH